MSVKKIERSAIVPFSAAQMFSLVNDVESYPDFMASCSSAQILARGEHWLEARLELSKAGMRQSFITRNTLSPPSRIGMSLQQGPFKHLEGEWRFDALGEQACKVSFVLQFEFARGLLSLAGNVLFEKVASDQVDVFCRRARQLYASP